jgi:hypothetical protein
VKRAVVSACMRAREHQSRRGVDVGDSDETRRVPDSARDRDGGGQNGARSREPRRVGRPVPGGLEVPRRVGE